MKLTQDTEAAKKEDGDREKSRFSRAPLTEKIIARVAAVVIAAAVPVASCTFEPNGLETLPDSSQDAGNEMDGGPDAEVDGGHDAGPDIDAGPDAGPDIDSGTDAGPDVDAGTDAGLDAGPDVDAGTDAGPDVDAGTDAGPDVDAGSDAGPDVDAGVDAGPDVDAGPVACVSAGVGTFSGVIMTATPQTVGGYVFEYLGNSGVNALFTISCGGNILEASYACPGGFDTVIDDVPSGRRITIHPNSAGAGQTNSSISVQIH